MNSCSSLLSIIYQFIILSFIRVLFVLPFFPHFTMSIVTIVNSHLIVDLFLLLLLLLSFATNNAIMLNSKDIIEALVSSVCVYFIILILLNAHLFLLLLLLLSFATNNAIMLNSKDIIEALVSSVRVYFIILMGRWSNILLNALSNHSQLITACAT